jgi:peptide-methionine (R)-S-oxide reductase
MKNKIKKSDKEWRKKLTPQQYLIMRKKGTELAFSGKYLNNNKKGIYICTACGCKLFSSDAKFDSGTGWPSFYSPISKNSIEIKEDKSYGIIRTEVKCNKCGGHLGHVFNDGPTERKRYCINSTFLEFKKL